MSRHNPEEVRKARKAWVIGMILATLIWGLMNHQAEAYEYDGEKWDLNDEFDYFMDPGCPDFLKLFFRPTVEKMSPIEIDRRGEITGYWGRDGMNRVFCGDEPPGEPLQLSWATPGLWYKSEDIEGSVGEAILGRAGWWYNNQKRIIECDMWFNSDRLTLFNVLLLIKHEYGHCLGLQHSESITSVMYRTALVRDLSADDWAGIYSLYNICETKQDKQLNTFIPVAEHPETGVLLSGILDEGGVWPYDVYEIRPALCKLDKESSSGDLDE